METADEEGLEDGTSAGTLNVLSQTRDCTVKAPPAPHRSGQPIETTPLPWYDPATGPGGLHH